MISALLSGDVDAKSIAESAVSTRMRVVENVNNFREDLFESTASIDENSRPNTLLVTEQAKHKVFRANVVVIHTTRFGNRVLNNRPGTRRKSWPFRRQLAARLPC